MNTGSSSVVVASTGPTAGISCMRRIDGTPTLSVPGYWNCLYTRGNESDATRLEYCVVRYAGSTGNGSVYCEEANGSSSPVLQRCRIERGSGAGIYSLRSGPKIYATRIQANTGYAVKLAGFSNVQLRDPSEPGLPEDVLEANA